jgi:hypothetical protein
MDSDASRLRTPWRWPFAIAYVLASLLLLAQVARFHDERTGFSSLITFGSRFEARRLPQLAELPLYTYSDSDGYDGQFYAQMAVSGNPVDPRLHAALDAPAYRLRRVLLPLVVHVAGAGDPQRILRLFALANVATWLLLAWLLARWWFPPTDLQNLVRWAGTLFGHGVLASIRHCLTDLPALLLIAIAVRALQQHRRWLGAVVLAAAGLVRETSLICAPALLPRRDGSARDWRAAVTPVATAVLPVVAWTFLLVVYFRSTGGIRNIDWPLESWANRWFEVHAAWRAQQWGTLHVLWALVGTAVQAGVVLARPRLDDLWWRIGAAHSVLWICLGAAVWEGIPAAAARATVPLSLAFNVLVPRTRLGMALLLAGNLTVLSAAMTLTPPWAAG